MSDEALNGKSIACVKRSRKLTHIPIECSWH